VTFLLDTNVISEWTRPRPDSGVVAWLAAVDEDRTFISVVTLAELRYGVARAAPGRRRDRLNTWLVNELPLRFEGRVLPIDAATADTWGEVTARGASAGRPIHAMDAFLAATALLHGLTVVTRDASAFQAVGTPVLNPWTNN
jgi:toxin FitB